MGSVPPVRRHRFQLPLFVGALALLAACSSSGGSDSASTSPTTVAASTSTAAPATTEPTTTAPPTSSAPTTTVAVDDVVYPGVDWETAPFPADLDQAALDAAVDLAFGAPDNAARVRSILAVHEGRIVYERYHPLDSADTIMPSYSVAKSFTSAVIGMLVDDGKLVVDDPAPVAAWADPADPRHAITLADLLHMSSGLEWTESYGPGSAFGDMLAAPVMSEWVASQPLEAEPNTQFEYSTATTALLAGILTDTIGGPDATDEYISERLLDPIGITSTQFTRDSSGRWVGGIGADSTARDFARFGWLFANDGRWEGEQLVPESWVEYSRTPSSTNPQYGAQWWMLRPEAFEARGLFGQLIVVAPDHELVIVITTNQGGGADALLAAAYEVFTGISSESPDGGSGT